MSSQLIMISLEELVDKNHPYRKLLSLIDFKGLSKILKEIKKNAETGRKGYGVEQCLKMLTLQFMEDLSDREMERYLEENNSAKLFCGFDLAIKTPDFSYFSKIRSVIGTNKLAKIFNKVREQLMEQGLIREVFTFVDASHLISKVNIWEDRDKLIKKGLEGFNNDALEKNSKEKEKSSSIKADTQARMGCKGKKKYWFGYKRHASVDMQSGLINKATITPANVTDAKAVKHILPNSGAVFGDKGYCTKDSTDAIKKKGLHDCTIKKNNMEGKNREKDRWISQMRSPYERVFSKMSKRVRYRGIEKSQFAFFMDAMAHNFKRLMTLDAESVQRLEFST